MHHYAALSPSLLTASPIYSLSHLHIMQQQKTRQLTQAVPLFLNRLDLPSFDLTSREHKNRQYNNRKRADTYYPVSVICPVHLLLVFHTLQTLFQLVIGFTFHTLLLSFHAYEPSSFSSRLPSRSTPRFPAL